MNKIEIEVPYNVRYISEWDDFNTDLLKGHSIINKTITGCGFTHYCLTNNIPTILCSPRKFLLENKHEQLKNTYLVVNENEKGVFIDEKAIKERCGNISKKENLDELDLIKDNLRSYILNSQLSQIAPKILVTYDSLKHVLFVLGESAQNYSIIVDEFQNIFMDSAFKAETELDFVKFLQQCPNVTYLSATPYIEEYLNELDEFKNLPYYEFKWDSSKLRSINVNFKKSYSISKEVDKIIDRYKESNFPVKIDNNKNIHQSKEVVFYVNSVRMICSIIKRNKLTKDQTNVICSNTKSNREALSRVGLFIGKAPLKGEPHKMFTFCTRTTYVGADFYSTSAITVVVSDCKINSLSSDIRMDFPQIMGRQRLKENVFRDECIFIYSLSDKDITMEEFKELSNQKLFNSSIDISNYNTIKNSGEGNIYVAKFLSDIRDRIKNYQYQNDYTGINSIDGTLVVNKLVLLAERRAFELRSDVYKTTVSVYNEFSSIENIKIGSDDTKITQICLNARKQYEKSNNFVDKMKILCSLILDELPGRISISELTWINREHLNYLNYLGAEKIRSLSYAECTLKREISGNLIISDIRERIISCFIPGKKYLLSDIKATLRKVYDSFNLSRAAKATDLMDYFEVRLVKIYDSLTKKQSSGYEIIRIKE